MNKNNDIGIEIHAISGKLPQIKETLTRMGIINFTKKELYQTAHVYEKDDKVYIAHFKELYALNGKVNNMTDQDYARRNRIASMLSQWGMCVVDVSTVEMCHISAIRVIKHSDKDDWNIIQKFVGSVNDTDS